MKKEEIKAFLESLEKSLPEKDPIGDDELRKDWYLVKNCLYFLDTLDEFRTWDESYLWKFLAKIFEAFEFDITRMLSKESHQPKAIQKMLRLTQMISNQGEDFDTNPAIKTRKKAFEVWNKCWFWW